MADPSVARMARIEGVPAARAGLFTRLAYWISRRMLGKVPEPLAVTAHHPWVFRAYGGFEWALRKATRVDPKLKALAQLKGAALVGCPF
jgi:hypothetical protein